MTLENEAASTPAVRSGVPEYDFSDIWAKFDEFEKGFARLFDLAAEKFAGAVENHTNADEEASIGGGYIVNGATAIREGSLDAVQIEYSEGVGRVLVAARPFDMHEILLEEQPALLLRQDALQRISRLCEVASTLPSSFLRGLADNYEAHLIDAPVGVAAQIEEALAEGRCCVDGDHWTDEDKADASTLVLTLYMVFRINGMQWGRDHVAICDIASKASHSCEPNAVFGHRALGSKVRVSKLNLHESAEVEDIAADEQQHMLEVKSTKPLAIGELVTLSYMDDPDDLICPTVVRRRRLQMHRFFTCRCTRCSKADEQGDPCRGFPCLDSKCPGVVVAPPEHPSETLDVKRGSLETLAPGADCAARYIAESGGFGNEAGYGCAVRFACLCCGRRGVDTGLLELETQLSEELGKLHAEFGELSLVNIAFAAGMASDAETGPFTGSGDNLARIEKLYSASRALGKAHWLHCRAALLKWRLDLARARLGVNGSDLQATLLSESISFVEARCPELLAFVAAPWVAEAARYLCEEGDTSVDVMLVYPQFASLERACRKDQGFGRHSPFEECFEEAWLIQFQACMDMDLDTMD